jgi:hypothetical protein
MLNKIKYSFLMLIIILMAGCSKNAHEQLVDSNFLLKDGEIVNSNSAYIPAQCYAKIKQESGHESNPCYSCHVDGVRPNFLHDDSGLQQAFDFTDYSSKNRYSNLFKDRSKEVEAMSDEAIDEYVSTSNYFDKDGSIKINKVLNNIPENWDANKDGLWNGFTPDTYFSFDNQGFDIDPNGKPTGWVAFSYYPFLGGFMPTNGSTDDVLIRLPEYFRQDDKGQYSADVYKLNLAIVESLVREKNITIAATNEDILKVDLNKNGILDKAETVVYSWAPLKDIHMSYVGKAKQVYEQSSFKIAAGLYPKGTEFLHSVRYLKVDGNKVSMSDRMKELRYSKKITWNNYSQLSKSVSSEIKERHDFPNRVSQYHSPRNGGIEQGLISGRGWNYQGFIEDHSGELRPQNYEETLSCMGCHTGVGATTDSSFAFPRKFAFDSFQNGYYHWSQKDLVGVADPIRQDGKHEYSYYLENTLSGDEFGINLEVMNKFTHSGKISQQKLGQLKNDISLLLLPSIERARTLNKAYKVIVDEQSYIYGRDAHVLPLKNMYKTIPVGEDTGVTNVVHASPL